MKSNDRSDALDILLHLFQERQPLTHLLKKPALSPLTKALCFGVTRYFFQLEAMAEALVDKRPKDLTVWLSILMGLYQIDQLSMPDYAVVQETVALLQQYKKVWAKGFVNAILRRFCREGATLKTSLNANPAFIYAHPAWLVRRVQQDWPEQWQTILTANNTHPPMTLRVNQQHTSRDAYSTRLTQLHIKHTCLPNSNTAVILDQATNVQDIPGFLAGDVSVQDAAAQFAAPLLDLQPGCRVLDACCAPGGKTGHLLELEPQLALCIGLDIEAQRLDRVRDNCERLKLYPTLITGDASKPSTWWDGIPFDRILIDAPCSATGIIRRHPDIKILRTPEDIANICLIQAQILEALWPLLAPGGILVYATCSIMPAENEHQIATFIQQHPEATVDTTDQPWGHNTGHGWQIFPGETYMDGFFYAKIVKSLLLVL